MNNVIEFRILICIMIFYTTLSSCNNDSNIVREMPQTVIGTGNLNGNGNENIPKINLVIDNEQDWVDLVAKIDSYNKVSDRFTETDIDFSAYKVLAVFEEVKMTGGYTIQIEQIIETNNHIEAIINTGSPSGGAYAAITQPFFISKIKKTNKKIIFIE